MDEKEEILRNDRDRTMTPPAEPPPAPKERCDEDVERAVEQARRRDPTTPTGDAG
jgi:hypothetical protein